MKKNKLLSLLTLFASSMCVEQAVANNCCYQPNPCCVQNEEKFFLRGDVLYWQPNISGIELGFGTGAIAQTSVGDTTVIISDEYDADPHFNWDAGYRVAGGYGIENSWGIGAEWTYFKGDGDRRSFDNGDITSAGKFKVKLEQIDLVLGYDYAFNCDFHLKPFFGVRGARIRNGVAGLITTQLTIDGEPAVGEIRAFDHKQNYRAIGAILGFQADYNIGCGFGLYGTAAASVLYGRIKVNMDDATVLGSTVNNVIITANRRHVHSYDPVVDLAVGASWKTNFFECAELSMRLGFEHHEYFHQNHFSVFRGDMSFTGGIFSVEVAL